MPGDVVLVCDVGGGTTDFSLIAVLEATDGELALERIAVGDHILLGGDNMDLALAAVAERTLVEQGKQLDALQQRGLVHACRRAKETLLADGAPAAVPVALLGRGSKLIAAPCASTCSAPTPRRSWSTASSRCAPPRRGRRSGGPPACASSACTTPPIRR